VLSQVPCHEDVLGSGEVPVICLGGGFLDKLNTSQLLHLSNHIKATT